MNSQSLSQQIVKQTREGNYKHLVKQLFHIELTPSQEKIVEAIHRDKHKRVVISAMTRYGKSMSVAIGVILYILAHPGHRVAIIGPTNKQARIIMEYVGQFLYYSPILIQCVDWEKTKLERLKSQVTQYRITFWQKQEIRIISVEGRGQSAMGFGANLVVEDEACLIPDEVYRIRIRRMLGDDPNSKLVEIGNPFDRLNHMYKNWINNKYHRIHIDWKIAIAEGRTSTEWIEEERSELTPQEFCVLYDAKFPEDSEDTLIPYDWIRRALKVKWKDCSIKRKILGIDVAEGGGDFTVVTEVDETVDRRFIVRNVWHWSIEDTMVTSGNILRIAKEVKPDLIKIDALSVGKGVADDLKQHGMRVIPIKVSQLPRREKWRFANKKAQFYWFLRILFEEKRINLEVEHSKQIEELNSLRFERTSGEKIRIIRPGVKDRSGKAVGKLKSPDFSDSLMFACANEIQATVYWGGEEKKDEDEGEEEHE